MTESNQSDTLPVINETEEESNHDNVLNFHTKHSDASQKLEVSKSRFIALCSQKNYLIYSLV